MANRRSASCEPEDLVASSSLRRSARIRSNRADSPALLIPQPRTRRSLSTQEQPTDFPLAVANQLESEPTLRRKTLNSIEENAGEKSTPEKAVKKLTNTRRRSTVKADTPVAGLKTIEERSSKVEENVQEKSSAAKKLNYIPDENEAILQPAFVVLEKIEETLKDTSEITNNAEKVVELQTSNVSSRRRSVSIDLDDVDASSLRRSARIRTNRSDSPLLQKPQLRTRRSSSSHEKNNQSPLKVSNKQETETTIPTRRKLLLKRIEENVGETLTPIKDANELTNSPTKIQATLESSPILPKPVEDHSSTNEECIGVKTAKNIRSSPEKSPIKSRVEKLEDSSIIVDSKPVKTPKKMVNTPKNSPLKLSPSPNLEKLEDPSIIEEDLGKKSSSANTTKKLVNTPKNNPVNLPCSPNLLEKLEDRSIVAKSPKKLVNTPKNSPVKLQSSPNREILEEDLGKKSASAKTTKTMVNTPKNGPVKLSPSPNLQKLEGPSVIEEDLGKKSSSAKTPKKLVNTPKNSPVKLPSNLEKLDHSKIEEDLGKKSASAKTTKSLTNTPKNSPVKLSPSNVEQLEDPSIIEEDISKESSSAKTPKIMVNTPKNSPVKLQPILNLEKLEDPSIIEEVIEQESSSGNTPKKLVNTPKNNPVEKLEDPSIIEENLEKMSLRVKTPKRMVNTPKNSPAKLEHSPNLEKLDDLLIIVEDIENESSSDKTPKKLVNTPRNHPPKLLHSPSLSETVEDPSLKSSPVNEANSSETSPQKLQTSLIQKVVDATPEIKKSLGKISSSKAAAKDIVTKKSPTKSLRSENTGDGFCIIESKSKLGVKSPTKVVNELSNTTRKVADSSNNNEEHLEIKSSPAKETKKFTYDPEKTLKKLQTILEVHKSLNIGKQMEEESSPVLVSLTKSSMGIASPNKVDSSSESMKEIDSSEKSKSDIAPQTSLEPIDTNISIVCTKSELIKDDTSIEEGESNISVVDTECSKSTNVGQIQESGLVQENESNITVVDNEDLKFTDFSPKLRTTATNKEFKLDKKAKDIVTKNDSSEHVKTKINKLTEIYEYYESSEEEMPAIQKRYIPRNIKSTITETDDYYESSEAEISAISPNIKPRITETDDSYDSSEEETPSITKNIISPNIKPRITETDESYDSSEDESPVIPKRITVPSDPDSDEEDCGNRNEFLDDMASVGSESTTPSINSNDIIEKGESVGSSSSQNDFSDDEYENDSFVVDDDLGNADLLSCGSSVEDEEHLNGSGQKRIRRRIIVINSDSEPECCPSLDVMSTHVFPGSSPQQIRVNQVESVDSDQEKVRQQNEELSRMIEEECDSLVITLNDEPTNSGPIKCTNKSLDAETSSTPKQSRNKLSDENDSMINTSPWKKAAKSKVYLSKDAEDEITVEKAEEISKQIDELFDKEMNRPVEELTKEEIKEYSTFNHKDSPKDNRNDYKEKLDKYFSTLQTPENRRKTLGYKKIEFVEPTMRRKSLGMPAGHAEKFEETIKKHKKKTGNTRNQTEKLNIDLTGEETEGFDLNKNKKTKENTGLTIIEMEQLTETRQTVQDLNQLEKTSETFKEKPKLILEENVSEEDILNEIEATTQNSLKRILDEEYDETNILLDFHDIVSTEILTTSSEKKKKKSKLLTISGKQSPETSNLSSHGMNIKKSRRSIDETLSPVMETLSSEKKRKKCNLSIEEQQAPVALNISSPEKKMKKSRLSIEETHSPVVETLKLSSGKKKKKSRLSIDEKQSPESSNLSSPEKKMKKLRLSIEETQSPVMETLSSEKKRKKCNLSIEEKQSPEMSYISSPEKKMKKSRPIEETHSPVVETLKLSSEKKKKKTRLSIEEKQSPESSNLSSPEKKMKKLRLSIEEAQSPVVETLKLSSEKKKKKTRLSIEEKQSPETLNLSSPDKKMKKLRHSIEGAQSPVVETLKLSSEKKKKKSRLSIEEKQTPEATNISSPEKKMRILRLSIEGAQSPVVETLKLSSEKKKKQTRLSLEGNQSPESSNLSSPDKEIKKLGLSMEETQSPVEDTIKLSSEKKKKQFRLSIEEKQSQATSNLSSPEKKMKKFRLSFEGAQSPVMDILKLFSEEKKKQSSLSIDEQQSPETSSIFSPEKKMKKPKLSIELAQSQEISSNVFIEKPVKTKKVRKLFKHGDDNQNATEVASNDNNFHITLKKSITETPEKKNLKQKIISNIEIEDICEELIEKKNKRSSTDLNWTIENTDPDPKPNPTKKTKTNKQSSGDLEPKPNKTKSSTSESEYDQQINVNKPHKSSKKKKNRNKLHSTDDDVFEKQSKSKINPLPDHLLNFIVQNETVAPSKSETDSVPIAAPKNIYKNLIRPSGSGTTTQHKVERINQSSMKIRKHKKNDKSSLKLKPALIKASLTGQIDCFNFKEEYLFGDKIKRMSMAERFKQKK